MRKLLLDYENHSNHGSLVRLRNFSEQNFSKVNHKKLLKLLDEFEEMTTSGVFRVKRDYYNFRRFVFSKEV